MSGVNRPQAVVIIELIGLDRFEGVQLRRPSGAPVVCVGLRRAACSPGWRLGNQINIDLVVNCGTPTRPERGRPDEDQVSTVAANE